MEYANATEVLPPGLVAQIREHYTGLIYVPTEAAQENKTRNAERKALLSDFRVKGFSVKKMAQAAGISEQRVRVILKSNPS